MLCIVNTFHLKMLFLTKKNRFWWKKLPCFVCKLPHVEN